MAVVAESFHGVVWCRLLSKDGDEEDVLMERVVKLEAEAEAKDEDWKARLSELRRGYETEAQKMRYARMIREHAGRQTSQKPV